MRRNCMNTLLVETPVHVDKHQRTRELCKWNDSTRVNIRDPEVSEAVQRDSFRLPPSAASAAYARSDELPNPDVR